MLPAATVGSYLGYYVSRWDNPQQKKTIFTQLKPDPVAAGSAFLHHGIEFEIGKHKYSSNSCMVW